MKTFNFKSILKITLISICITFFPVNNKAGKDFCDIDGQLLIKADNLEISVKDTLNQVTRNQSGSDTLDILTKYISSIKGSQPSSITDNINNENNIKEKANTEATPRNLANVLIDVLIKRISLMLNK